MDVEYLWRAKTQEVEREIAHIRLAERASSQHRRAASAPKRRTTPAIPLRLLRALRPAS